MKYKAAHKPAVTQRLKQQAARQIRSQGLPGVSVKSLMAAEGMTVGGFYAHFESKEQMLVEAIRSAFAESVHGFYQLIDKRGDEEWLQSAIQLYLHAMHRDNPALGCPVASLMSDIARAERPLKKVFEDELKQLADLYVPKLQALGDPQAQDTALAIVALMAGALQLSRSVIDEQLSKRVLEQAAKTVWAIVESARAGHIPN